MTKKALTSEGVKRLRAPTTGRLEIGDLTLPGLELRVTENGIKSWAVLYRVMGEGAVNGTGRLRKGKLKRLTLGRYPILASDSPTPACLGARIQKAQGCSADG